MKKSEVVDLLRAMPEEIDLDELMERLYLMKKLEAAEAEVAAGHLLLHEEVVRLTDEWFK